MTSISLQIVSRSLLLFPVFVVPLRILHQEFVTTHETYRHARLMLITKILYIMCGASIRYVSKWNYAKLNSAATVWSKDRGWECLSYVILFLSCCSLSVFLLLQGPLWFVQRMLDEGNVRLLDPLIQVEPGILAWPRNYSSPCKHCHVRCFRNSLEDSLQLENKTSPR